MQQFWEDNHIHNNPYWLSNSTPIDVLTLHNINYNVTGKKILDIGVGTGRMSQYLFSNKNKVFSSDISEVALNNVKDIAIPYHTTKLKDIEKVDIAICHLVFQHCTNQEVQRIINDVNLNDDGFFSFQFAFLRENEEPNDNVKSLINASTHYFRSIDIIEQMVSNTNKKIIYISEPIHWYTPENFSWYIVRVMNNV